jgi:hypothetical protein
MTVTVLTTQASTILHAHHRRALPFYRRAFLIYIPSPQGAINPRRSLTLGFCAMHIKIEMKTRGSLKEFEKHADHEGHKPRTGCANCSANSGPGLLVTVGFSDRAMGVQHRAGLNTATPFLWMVTLSTIMLNLLQHNVAQLGIVTGDCFRSRAKAPKPWRPGRFSFTGIDARHNAMAEILGAQSP